MTNSQREHTGRRHPSAPRSRTGAALGTGAGRSRGVPARSAVRCAGAPARVVSLPIGPSGDLLTGPARDLGPSGTDLPLAVGFGAVPLPARLPVSEPSAEPVAEPRPALRICPPVPVPETVPLHAPRPASCVDAPPVRLTARGRLAAVVLVSVVLAGVLALAWQGAHAGHGAVRVPASVTVHRGDTLWDIASRVAPDRDPRAEVAVLQRLNHLDGTALQPGLTLRTR